MATAVQFELQGDSSNFTFDVEGTYFPRLEAEYKTAANPPQIVALREVWEIRGARLTNDALSPSSLWTEWVALRSRLATRGSSFPTYARFVIPGGATLHTLGPSTHEGFLVEVLESDPRDLTPEEAAGGWRTVAPVTLRVSAVQKFADANGIVGWEQEVTHRYPDGRHELEWITRITTAEGTSAITKAQSYAGIDATALGGTYLYETNGTGGVELQVVDADEENSRTPTVVVATSRVRAYGVTIGDVTAGSSPSDVSLAVTTRVTAKERITTTTATARGPSALQFVEAQAPAVFNESEIVDEQAQMFASGTWSQREESSTASGDRTDKSKTGITATIVGGLPAIDFEPVADAGDPVQFLSACKLPVAATVDIALEAVGPSFDINTLPLPGHPGDDWVLDSAASSEGEPTLAEKGANEAGNKWTRAARLVFRRSKAPSQGGGILESIAKASKVPSHIYGA